MVGVHVFFAMFVANFCGDAPHIVGTVPRKLSTLARLAGWVTDFVHGCSGAERN